MSKNIDGYISIRTSTIISDRRLAMDVYVPVQGRPVRYGAIGERLDDERYKRLRSFKISKVYIKKESESAYRKDVENMLDEADNNDKIETGLKAQMVTGGAESATESLIEKVEDKSVYLEAQAHYERFAKFMQQHSGGFGEVIRISGQVPGDYVCHGVQVAALSIFLCENLGLIRNEEHLKSISTACFIHDIGAERAKIPLNFDKAKLTPDQLKAWQRHPVLAIEQMGELDHIDRQVLDIVFQHEEIPNGSGFPKALKRKEMDPIACVVSLANRFDHYSTQFSGDKKAAIASFFKNELGRFDLDQLELLKKVINENS